MTTKTKLNSRIAGPVFLDSIVQMPKLHLPTGGSSYKKHLPERYLASCRRDRSFYYLIIVRLITHISGK